MPKVKHSVPKSKVETADFIKFSKVQQDYIREVFRRTNQEFNNAIEAVYEEVGILEEVNKTPDKYILRQDFTGVEVNSKERQKA